MSKRAFWAVVSLLAVAAMVGGCGGDDDGEPLTSEVRAKRATPGSMSPDDAVWNDARVTLIGTDVIEGSRATKAVEVKMQAVYNDTDVWFRFEWADETESVHRAWEFDGTEWTSSGNEDRLALYWEITPIDRFQTRGCAVLCHNPESDPIEDWYMITPGQDDRADNWHWKAARTNPVGQVDDKYLTGVLEDPEDVESANHGDKKDSGGYVNNRAEDGSGPAKMQDPAKESSIGEPFILVTEAVTLDASLFNAGDKLPRELLDPWTGSRGDIETMGTWQDGTWTVVFRRKLDTGNDDDVRFVRGRTYPFGMGVFDNIGGINHTISTDVVTLRFD